MGSVSTDNEGSISAWMLRSCTVLFLLSALEFGVTTKILICLVIQDHIATFTYWLKCEPFCLYLLIIFMFCFASNDFFFLLLFVCRIKVHRVGHLLPHKLRQYQR